MFRNRCLFTHLISMKKSLPGHTLNTVSLGNFSSISPSLFVCSGKLMASVAIFTLIGFSLAINRCVLGL